MNVGMSRVSTATVVAIVPPGPRASVVETLTVLSKAGVRPIIISLDDNGDTVRHDEDGTIVIERLRPQFLDNAVASLRLSSLPTLVWWCAAESATLQDLAALVDRVVLDVEDPSAVWPLVPALAPLAPMGDVRWARLTRWRALIAQFFDLPEVRESAGRFEQLTIAGHDRFETRLLAGWLKARLPHGRRLGVVLEPGGPGTVEAVRLDGPRGTLGVKLLANGTCLETSVTMGSGHSARRVVAVGDQRPLALLGEELRVRSRDLAFEDAVREAEQL